MLKLDIFNIEERACTRVQNLMTHFVDSSGIDAEKARFVINTSTGKLCIHLYEDMRFLKTLDMDEISEFFGSDYDEHKVDVLQNYLIKVSREYAIELPSAHLVICKHEGKFGIHLFCNEKYISRLTMFDLLKEFYFPS